jgi:hypothetical protein
MTAGPHNSSNSFIPAPPISASDVFVSPQILSHQTKVQQYQIPVVPVQIMESRSDTRQTIDDLVKCLY